LPILPIPIQYCNTNNPVNNIGLSLEFDVVTNPDLTWNINLNTPTRSLKGILLQVTVEGIPNQLYAQGMLPYWDEIEKEFAREDLKGAELSSTDISTYFRSRYALWLDFRSSDDRKLHGSGRRVENASEGVTLQGPYA